MVNGAESQETGALSDYWQSGRASSITAYSPPTQTSFDLRCSAGDEIVCTNSTGAAIRFRSSSIALYGQAQADRYAHTHDLGPSTTPSTAGSAGPSSPSSVPANFCTTHTCIPYFPEGDGYIVQCNDGEWSHSGGRPGACSSHDGESSATYP